MKLTRRYFYTGFIFGALTASFFGFVNMSQAPVEFNEACYLDRYPAVAKKWVAEDRSALSHWKKFGQFEDRIPGCTEKQVKDTRAASSADPNDPNLQSPITD